MSMQSSNSSDFDEWPPHLAWVLSRLQQETIQEFHESPVDSGPPKRRPKTSPYFVLRGTVEIDDATRRDLQELFLAAKRPFALRLNADDKGETKIAVFHRRPWDPQTQTINGRTTYQTEIVLRLLSTNPMSAANRNE